MVVQDSPGDRFKPSGEEEKKDAKDPGNKDNEVLSTEEPKVNQEKDVNVNSTNNINTISPTANAASIKDNAVDKDIVYGCTDDLNMPNLEEINYSDDDENVGVEADMTNLDFNIPRAIGTKWIYRNKKDKKGIVVRNKARLVAQGHTQEKGIMMRIEKEVYVCQPLRFEDLEFPDSIYKLEKALYGLHQAPRACDFAGASLDKKSTTGDCQFLRNRLISRQCKKQTVVANSTTEANVLYTNDDWNEVKQLLRMEFRLTLLKVNLLGKLTTAVD
nr:hypothetical protein [Tanacetum cinerariifolium]